MVHRGDGADRRDRRQAAQHLALDGVGHEIAAVGPGAGRERLRLEALQAGRLAGAHIGLERRLVLGDRGIAGFRGGERRPTGVERDAVDPALGLVERVADAGELLLGEGIGREPRLDLREARFVGVLEGREGAGELVIGGGHLGGLGLGSLEGSHVGSSDG